MTEPRLSVILNTARSGHSMLGFPDIHHFAYTINTLRRQSFRSFELIISDYIHDRRKFNWDSIHEARFPIYHVPIDNSLAHKMGYCAISGTKNNGLMYASGEYVIFLDDCCTFESHLLQRIFQIWQTRGLFANALHKKEIGTQVHVGRDGTPIQDCRYVLFDHHKTHEIIDSFHMYGYSSCSMEAALKVNGFDEMLDFSRQLEDIDFGERLKRAGYHIVLNKAIFVVEQEHKQLAPQPVGKPEGDKANTWNSGKEDDVKLGENLKCNGPILWMKNKLREGDDLFLANHRRMTEEELSHLDPCYLLDGEHCNASNMNCNFLTKADDGTLLTKHMAHQDCKRYLEEQPVFNLAHLRSQKMNDKERYRVK